MNRLYNFFKRYILVLFTSLSLTAYAQTGCDCPTVCNPCAGGIYSLTLKYIGGTSYTVSVLDDYSLIFQQSLSPGQVFTVNGGLDGEFEADELRFFTGIFLNTSINVTCAFEFDPSIEHGSFKIISAVSSGAGPVCCTSNVADIQAPVISGCPSPNITVDATSGCSATVGWQLPVATDCNLDTLIGTHQPNSVFPIGTTTVLYTAKDFNNNTSTCGFTVTVNDKTPPLLVSSPGTMNLSADANCKAKATWAPPSFTDCSGVTLSTSHSSGSDFPIGTTPVTCTATDFSGNTSQCQFNVIVKDQTAPVVTNCPGPITVNAGANCKAKTTWAPPSFTDNCSSVSVISSHTTAFEFPVGTTEVKYTLNDVAGNTTICKFDVTVKDNVFPVISGCPDNIMVITPNASGKVNVDWAPVVATDDCTIFELTASHEPGDLFPIGETLVTYTATDVSGNVTTCSFNVSVVYENTMLEIEQLITPDGNGINDEWVIGNIEKYETNKVVIVDRWGSLVYSANGYNNHNKVWDGHNSNGNVVPTGTYFYTILVHKGSAVLEKTGFIELVR